MQQRIAADERVVSIQSPDEEEKFKASRFATSAAKLVQRPSSSSLRTVSISHRQALEAKAKLYNRMHTTGDNAEDEDGGCIHYLLACIHYSLGILYITCTIVSLSLRQIHGNTKVLTKMGSSSPLIGSPAIPPIEIR